MADGWAEEIDISNLALQPVRYVDVDAMFANVLNQFHQSHDADIVEKTTPQCQSAVGKLQSINNQQSIFENILILIKKRI